MKMRLFLPRISRLKAQTSSKFAAFHALLLTACGHNEKVIRPDFHFEYAFSRFPYHGDDESGAIHSLSDLSEQTNLTSLLPQRRPHGSPTGTLSVISGDDAMLVSSSLVAIADGVSGWEDKPGQNSSQTWSRSFLETLSRLLMEYLTRYSPRTLSRRDIDQILDDSFLHTSHLMDIQKLQGSSTLLLAMISGNQLQIISIGDSKVYVIRDGDIIKTNKEEMLGLSCPQQIGTHTLHNFPSSIATVDGIHLQNDDLVIMCSDGISDNLFDYEIAHYADEELNLLRHNLQDAANRILIEAKAVAFDDNAVTPYNQVVNALPSHSNTSFVGGKLDDMTLCVARVTSG